MNTVLKIFLSMSFSGGLLIALLLLGKRFLQDRISRQWQYYVWLIVLLRLLLPFGPETNLLGKTYQAVDRAIIQTDPLPRQASLNTPGGVPDSAAGLEQDNETANRPAEDLTTVRPLQEIRSVLANHIWLIWLAAALGMLIRKVTVYQGFLRYLNAGLVPIADIGILDRLSVIAEQAGIRKPVELCSNPLASSPLLIGFFHPCIVLPSADISEKDFWYIALHELTHYKRRDMFYKWLVQVAVCLHWFNPLVYFMSREITKACEFSCDEAVLAKVGCENAQDYGKTLLDAMAAVGKYRENLGAVTLSENKQLLKERLGAIMNFKRKSTAIRLLTGVLTLCVIFGASFIGVYSTAAASNQATDEPLASEWSKNATQEGTGTHSKDYSSQAQRYYEAGSLPLFEIAFSQLDENAQREWLEKLYTNNDISFFSVAVQVLEESGALFLDDFAEKAYLDEEIAFFSTLTDCMDETELEDWLDRALKDGDWAFQSVLFDALDRGDEFDELEEEQEKAQLAKYQAVGVTMEGKNYYYQGQLVNIFLDIRPDKSFYTLDTNPAGTVNIKIMRDTDNEITGVAYMTEAEVAELFEDEEELDDENSPEIIPVNLKKVAKKQVIWLGEYTLSKGDRIWYDVSAKTGKGMQIGFAKSGDKRLKTTYYSVKNLRQKGEPLKCTANFTFGPPVKPGKYKLFLRATNNTLRNIKGSISIALEDASLFSAQSCG